MTEKNSPFEEESGTIPSALAQVQYQPNANSIFRQSAIPLVTNDIAMGTNSSVHTGSIWNTFSSDDCAYEEKKTYEFKLVDGTKTMKTMSYRDIKNIVEFSTSKLGFSWKFPFFRKETRRITHVDFNNDSRSLDVDCNMSMFMSIVGWQYVSWNKALMAESVKYGTRVN